jgi:hypothetical protein
MTEPTPARPDPNTPRPILSLEGLQARYGIGKTKATELAVSDEFPNTVCRARTGTRSSRSRRSN